VLLYGRKIVVGTKRMHKKKMFNGAKIHKRTNLDNRLMDSNDEKVTQYVERNKLGLIYMDPCIVV
jgi:hypothetical protein